MNSIDNKTRINSIDGIRGLACIMIMLFHFTGKNNFIPLISRWGGGLGVEIFYCLSGFCISRAIYAGLIRDKQSGYSCLKFVYDRFKKIYPAYILSLIFVILTQGPRNLSEIMINVLMIQSGWLGKDFALNGPTWFLSTLLLCYIVFYVVNRLFGNSNNRIFVYILLMVYAKIIVDAQSTLPMIGESFGYAILPFFAGCILSDIQDLIDNNSNNNSRKLVTVLLIADIILIAASAAGNMLFGTEKALGDYWMIFSLLLIPLSVISIINVKPLDSFLENRIFVFLGSISMYVYIWHVPLGSFIHRIAQNAGLDVDGFLYLLGASAITIIWAMINMKLESIVKAIVDNRKEN